MEDTKSFAPVCLATSGMPQIFCGSKRKTFSKREQAESTEEQSLFLRRCRSNTDWQLRQKITCSTVEQGGACPMWNMGAGTTRLMLHFSDLEKETVRLDETHYRVTLWYKQSDETEILIRILSFGPVLRVIEPEAFLELIRERLKKQLKIDS